MAQQLTEEIKQFFHEPNFVHLAMVRADGYPQVAPVWATLDGDFVVISTGENSPKARALKENPKVGLSIVRETDPYHEAHLRGRVAEFRKEGAVPMMHAISDKYIGKDFPFPLDHQVSIYIEIEHASTRKIPFTPKHVKV